uniref:Uncharacterized protein n=1 Tax=Amphimedon queenslandica TaxID=400682 RepID=A0A1X7V116_AMPQE
CSLEEALRDGTICSGPSVTEATLPTNIGAIGNTSSSSFMALAVSTGFILIIIIIGIVSCVVIVLVVVIYKRKKKKQPHNEAQAHENPMFRHDEIKDAQVEKLGSIQ